MASDHRRAIGLFPDRPKTASALQALSDSGFNMSNVSIVARDAKREDAITGVDVKDEVSNQADTGGSIEALTGGVLRGVTVLLVGLGTVTIHSMRFYDHASGDPLLQKEIGDEHTATNSVAFELQSTYTKARSLSQFCLFRSRGALILSSKSSCL
ncbi:MAG: general stress protein [Cyanobacteria bacterium P01_E01_bin.6]